MLDLTKKLYEIKWEISELIMMAMRRHKNSILNQDKVQGSKKAYVLVKQVFQYKKVPSIGAVIDRNKELIEGLGTYSKCFRF